MREAAATQPARGTRMLLARSYRDAVLAEEMALCVIAEENEQEIIVVTCYKSSKLNKYLKTR